MHVKGFVMFVFFQILRQKLDNENNCTAEKEKKSKDENVIGDISANNV